MSLIEYHKTTTKELITVTHKVRNLVQHWAEDGRHKEVVLKNMLRRFLPEKYLIGTGFVVKQTGEDYGSHLTSKQIDIIIYDNGSPVLFKEGDFVILTPDSVKAIIEVKANLQNQGLTEIVNTANENGDFIISGKHVKNVPFFNGVFSYEGFDGNFNKTIFEQNYIAGNAPYLNRPNYENFKVNHVCLNKDWFLKYWPIEHRHSLYHLQDLSFSFFISNLMDILSNQSVRRNNLIWYATDKELNLNRSF